MTAQVQYQADEQGFVFKAFCPTGPGGGVDPTCSPGGGGSNGVKASKKASVATKKTGDKVAIRHAQKAEKFAVEGNHGNAWKSHREAYRRHSSQSSNRKLTKNERDSHKKAASAQLSAYKEHLKLSETSKVKRMEPVKGKRYKDGSSELRKLFQGNSYTAKDAKEFLEVLGEGDGYGNGGRRDPRVKAVNSRFLSKRGNKKLRATSVSEVPGRDDYAWTFELLK